MHNLEEQSHFLSRDTSPPGTGKIYSLCEMLMGDLNNYCECMIPIDDLNTLNIKLFPTYPPPPPVKSWQVPLFTVRPETLMDENWDLTMQRVVPYINGVNSVKKIALLADADYSLTRRCMKHLLYYGCLLLLDIFSFNAIYAPTAEFRTTIASDLDMQRECARYVNTAFAPTSNATNSSPTVPQQHPQPAQPATNGHSIPSITIPPPPVPQPHSSEPDPFPLNSQGEPLSGPAIVSLYAALRQGLSVREWYTSHSSLLANIDLRRFITFGVIKGFLYRVHKYALATGESPADDGKGQGRDGINESRRKGSLGHHRHIPIPFGPRNPRRPSQHRQELDASFSKIDTTAAAAATTTTTTTTSSFSSNSSSRSDDNDHSGAATRRRRRSRSRSDKLARYLDGTHPFDQICSELEVSERQLLEWIRKWAADKRREVVVIHR